MFGLVYALDLGIRSGFAKGKCGERPRPGAIVLKKPTEHRAVAFANLIAFLDEEFRADKPALLVKEAMWSLQANSERGNSEANVRMHAGLHAVVEGVCGRFGVPWREAPTGTIRKHFIGQAALGRVARGVKRTREEREVSREATKEAVRARCRLLGLMPKDPADPAYGDDNIADALACWDWGAATFGKQSVSVSELHLFGEEGLRP